MDGKYILQILISILKTTELSELVFWESFYSC